MNTSSWLLSCISFIKTRCMPCTQSSAFHGSFVVSLTRLQEENPAAFAATTPDDDDVTEKKVSSLYCLREVAFVNLS